jgi:ligand-binding SRPBCC domain-containing protein
MSKLYSLTCKQMIPATLAETWEFISSPKNLKEITPEYMGFQIITENVPDKAHTGMIIEYSVSPLLGIKMNWVTEITFLQEKKYFVDEQRFGPYDFWHHQHFIKPVKGGVEMTDIINYKIPLGFLGDIANRFFVNNRLKEIFAFRYKKIEEKFGVFQKN